MHTVLVVDDDPEFMCAAEQMLTAAGYQVLSASDGKQATEILEKKHSEIDLAIMDLALPGINGFEIIGAMSRRPNSVKIIATSGVYKDDLLTMAGTLGAHAAIRKPPHGKPIPERDWLRVVSRLLGDQAHEQCATAAGGNGTEDVAEPSNGTEA